jgi:opacity protein-like surface antigen
MKTLLTFIALLFASLAPAVAADAYPSIKDRRADASAVQTPAAQSWSGVWVAALAGYSMSNTDLSVDAFGTKDVAEFSGIGGEGFDLTAQLGGDVQMGNLVVGGWGEYQFGGTQSGLDITGLGKVTLDQCDSYGAFGRVGVAMGDTLVYGAGGYVWTCADLKFNGTKLGSLDFSGPAAEIGVEHRFSPNLRGKLSGRYTFIDDERVFEGGGFNVNAEPGVFAAKAGVVFSTTTVLPGLN